MDIRNLAKYKETTLQKLEACLTTKILNEYHKAVNLIIQEHYNLSGYINIHMVIFKDQMYFTDGIPLHPRILKKVTKGIPVVLNPALREQMMNVLEKKDAEQKKAHTRLYISYLKTALAHIQTSEDLKQLLPVLLHGEVKNYSGDNCITPEKAEMFKQQNKEGYDALCYQITLNMLIT